MTTQPPPDPQQRIYCLNCHYHLIGLDTNRCPECGQTFDPTNPDTFTTRAAPSNRRPILIGIFITTAIAMTIIACLPGRLFSNTFELLASITLYPLRLLDQIGYPGITLLLFLCIGTCGCALTLMRFIFSKPRLETALLIVIFQSAAAFMIFTHSDLEFFVDINWIETAARFFVLSCACVPLSLAEILWRRLEHRHIKTMIFMLISSIAFLPIVAAILTLSRL